MAVLEMVIWGLVCSGLNRIRGGLYGSKLHLGTTVTRLLSTACMMLPVLVHHHYLIYVSTWLALYLGFIFGWKAWQEMQTIPQDIGAMAIRGLVLTFLPGLILVNPLLIFSGLLIGPVYYLGTLLPNQQTSVEWGEWMFGFILGAVIGTT